MHIVQISASHSVMVCVPLLYTLNICGPLLSNKMIVGISSVVAAAVRSLKRVITIKTSGARSLLVHVLWPFRGSVENPRCRSLLTTP